MVQYDEWDEALPHVTFSLNTHVNTTTKVSPFEFAHGFLARVPLTMGLAERQDFDDDAQAVSLIERMENRHKAASDQMAASQVRLGHLLEKRLVASRVVPGDKESDLCPLLVHFDTFLTCIKDSFYGYKRYPKKDTAFFFVPQKRVFCVCQKGINLDRESTEILVQTVVGL